MGRAVESSHAARSAPGCSLVIVNEQLYKLFSAALAEARFDAGRVTDASRVHEACGLRVPQTDKTDSND